MCSEGFLDISHLPDALTKPKASKPGSSNMQVAHDLLDAQSICAALERNGQNRLAAARELGIHKTTLFRRIKKLGLSLPTRDGRSLCSSKQ
jgi:transcriptional regulator of acetoin/glycerol metabolism